MAPSTPAIAADRLWMPRAGWLVSPSATIRGSGMGFAIPPEELSKMLFGRVEAATLLWPNVYTNSAEMRTEVRLIDPFHRVKEVGLVFLPKDRVPAGFHAG